MFTIENKFGLQIRDAEPADMAAVARIYGHYVTHTVATFEETPPTEAQWHGRFWRTAEIGLPFLVAETAGAVVGYAYCSRWRARTAYRFTAEDSIYVHQDRVGQGIGTALLRRLLADCAQANVRRVIAVIPATGDPGSVSLHGRCGFTEVGRLRQVGYKHDQWIDTIMLQRDLDVGSAVADGSSVASPACA